jgi:hypothetical protein
MHETWYFHASYPIYLNESYNKCCCICFTSVHSPKILLIVLLPKVVQDIALCIYKCNDSFTKNSYNIKLCKFYCHWYCYYYLNIKNIIILTKNYYIQLIWSKLWINDIKIIFLIINTTSISKIWVFFSL